VADSQIGGAHTPISATLSWGSPMPRAKTSTILVLLACLALTAGCTRNDPTAPSDPPQPVLSEHQGADN